MLIETVSALSSGRRYAATEAGPLEAQKQIHVSTGKESSGSALVAQM